MRASPSGFSAFLCLGLLTACGTVRFARVGAVADARPNDCPVRFEHLTPQDAMAQGEREVGSGCAAGYSLAGQTGPTDDYTDDMKADVQPRACALGGDLVIITGTCVSDSFNNPSGNALPGVMLMVLTKTPGPLGPGDGGVGAPPAVTP